jgi:tellurite resistance protein TehA-like permease
MTTIFGLSPTADFIVFFVVNYGMFGAGVTLLIIAFAMVAKRGIYRKSEN